MKNNHVCTIIGKVVSIDVNEPVFDFCGGKSPTHFSQLVNFRWRQTI